MSQRARVAMAVALAVAVVTPVTTPLVTPAAAAATLSVSPRCGDGSPVSVDVVGSDLPAERTLRLALWSTDNELPIPLGLVDGGALGRISTSVPLPALGPGRYAVAVQENVSVEGPNDWEDVLSTHFQVPCPSVEVFPRRLAQRPGPLRLTLRADGYPFGRPQVVFRLDGALLASQLPDRFGSAVAVADLPGVPDCGSHLVTSEQSGVPADVPTAASTTLEVTCPTLEPDPGVVDVGTLPRPVGITGSGWDPDVDVTLEVDGLPGPQVTTDTDGSFRTDVRLPVRPCGAVTVTGVEVLPGDATGAAAPAAVAPPRAATSVTVTCPPQPTTTPSPSTPPATPPTTTPPTTTPPTGPPPTPPVTDPDERRPPAQLVTDAVVASGGVATARGAGFAPGRPVLLGWVLPDGTSAPGALAATTDAAGRFTVPCLVFPHARLGPRTLQAVQTAPGGVRAAAATVLVVNGPMEPGRNRLMGRR